MTEDRSDVVSRSFLLRVGWLIDGTGSSARKDVVMNINAGNILSLESARQYSSHSEIEIDYSGYTLIPCLVDSHVHLCMSGTGDALVREKQLNYSYKDAEKAISGHLHDQFRHGVVAVRDGGDYAGHVLRYRDKTQEIPVFLKSAGRGWRANGRYGRLVARPPFAGESLHDAILREKEPVDHLKVVNSGLASLKEFGKEGSPQFDSDQLKEAARFAERSGLKVMVHANGREPVKQSIDAGCHSIEHGFFMGKENIFKMADTRITWVPTAFTMKAYAENPSFPVRERDIAMKNYEHQLNQVSIAARSGVAIAVGTDSGSQGVNHGTAMRDEIRALMDGGLSIEMAMKCATVNGSVLLGLTDHPGGLTKGSPANFVALKGDISRLPDSLSDPIAIYMRGKKVFPPSP